MVERQLRLMEEEPEEFNSITLKIIKLLTSYPKTRDSDNLLLEKYYNVFEGLVIPITKVTTKPATIIRLRRKIQSCNSLLEATPDVKEQREQLQKNFRKKLSPKRLKPLFFNNLTGYSY